MKYLFALTISILFLLIPFVREIKSEEINLESLLDPETFAESEKIEDSKLSSSSINKLNIEDLLGPEDNFPFLPDNHRDSGTGKFNSF